MFARQILAICLLLSSFLAHSANQPYQHIALKKYATDQTATVAKLQGVKPIYLKFWATWCQPCMEQMPHFEALQKKYKDDINIVAVNINMNEEHAEIENVIKHFGLTMPVWLDNEGELGVALGLVGTPYSVLINRAGDIVYTSHESDAKLDKFIDLLANGQELSAQKTEAPTASQTQKLLQPWLQGEHLLFFTATWCDWYLAESRPEMSKQCINAQNKLNGLIQQRPDLPWHGLVNHLWTDEKALNDFTQLYKLTAKFSIDELGVLFNHFNIRSIPTLLWIKDGKIQQRITDFKNANSVLQQLPKASESER